MRTAYLLFVCLLHGLDAEDLISHNFRIVTNCKGGDLKGLKANQRELFYREWSPQAGMPKSDWSKPIRFTADERVPAVSKYAKVNEKGPFVSLTWHTNPRNPGSFCWRDRNRFADALYKNIICMTDAEFLKWMQEIIDESLPKKLLFRFAIDKPWKNEPKWNHVDIMSTEKIVPVNLADREVEGKKARIAPGNNYLNLVPAAGDRYGGAAAAAAAEMGDDYLLYDEALQDLELAQKEFELAHELIASDKELKQEQKRQRRVKVKRQPARSRVHRMYQDEEYYY